MSISCAVIIPSLNPDHRLKALAAALQSYDFAHIIVVDDGSDSAHKVNFPISTDRLTLLVHEVNRGKGAALKTAIHPLSHLTFIRLSGSASAPTRQSL